MTFEYSRNCEIKLGVDVPEGMQRVALGVEYNGAVFNGFQKQASTENTIQAYLERALSKIADEPITLVCAGRTDAGVNACEQIVHFDSLSKRPEKAWVQGSNTHLPDDIRIHWAKPMPWDFHARFSALSRTYRYVLVQGDVRSACLHKNVTWTRYTLDLKRMSEAAKYFVGEHDFSSFRSSQCQANSPVRKIEYLKVNRQGVFTVIEVKANAFLHHMVRNIVGVLLDIGRGVQEPSWAQYLIETRDRTQASPTARPWGLYFVRAEYPGVFSIPASPAGPIFLPGSE